MSHGSLVQRWIGTNSLAHAFTAGSFLTSRSHVFLTRKLKIPKKKILEQICTNREPAHLSAIRLIKYNDFLSNHLFGKHQRGISYHTQHNTQQSTVTTSLCEHVHIGRHTPLLHDCEKTSPAFKQTGARVCIKAESVQVLGSFKIRGIINMLNDLKKIANQSKGFVTMSAGNFGRSFSYITGQMGINSLIIMPDNVPIDRVKAIKGFGSQVELAPRMELKARVAEKEKDGWTFVHPFDDIRLFQGYGTVGLELFEQIPDADVVVCGVGGGGLIAGVAAALKLSGSQARIIGVEPSGAPSMYLSLKQGKAATLDKVNTFVNGLAPPYAGENAYEHVKQFVDEVVLVEDEEVKEAMKLLYNEQKLVVESAGAACVAAVLSGKVKDIQGKKVVCVVSGGNVSIEDLYDVFTKQ